jgi:transposase
LTGRPSECEPYREVILAKLAQDLTAQRIYQDLVAECGFAASYDSVKRFVRTLRAARPLPVRRIECLAGVEAQVDFGSGAPVVGPDGKRRRTHVFRIVLSHSRKGYSEATFRQTTEDFLTCVENAFRHFGGVPQILVIDNLRAAVKHPDWFDPELVPRFAAFCAHYGVAVLPTRPYMPRHKGKVERGVAYVQDNALKARSFDSLEAQNTHLAEWERTVADTRIHGTTRKQVGKVFADVERGALRPLPIERFPFFHEAQRIVSRDGHVEVAKAFYSVPPEYLARTVWVRWDARVVRIFNQRFEQIALHVRHEQGRFSTLGQHIAREKISGLERGTEYLLSRVALIGPHTEKWASAMITARGIEGTRVLMGILSLAKKHPGETLEKACEIALSHGAFHLRVVRQLLTRHAPLQQPLPFLDEHPVIRPLGDYAQIVAAAAARKGPESEGFLRHGWANEWSPNRNGPGGKDRQGLRDIHPPRSGYPSSGCTSAEPDSVSPDASSLRLSSPLSPGETP